MNNADWWAKKLGNTPQVPVGRPDPTPPMPATQQPMAGMPQFQVNQPPVSKAASAAQNYACPECGSNNYMSPSPGTIALRCYDCGYPVSQSGSRYGALTGAHVEGSAKQATGNSGTSGFSAIPEGYGANGQKLG